MRLSRLPGTSSTFSGVRLVNDSCGTTTMHLAHCTGAAVFATNRQRSRPAPSCCHRVSITQGPTTSTSSAAGKISRSTFMVAVSACWVSQGDTGCEKPRHPAATVGVSSLSGYRSGFRERFGLLDAAAIDAEAAWPIPSAPCRGSAPNNARRTAGSRIGSNSAAIQSSRDRDQPGEWPLIVCFLGRLQTQRSAAALSWG